MHSMLQESECAEMDCHKHTLDLGDAAHPRYRSASLVEVNAHSLFSKFFSESGKQVQKVCVRQHSFTGCLAFQLCMTTGVCTTWDPAHCHN